jgi:asparagine synthase (glutamine-hydrolysing)
MCGFTGFIDPSLTADEAGLLMHPMLACINHRGPDFTDSWYNESVMLGHNRLSIIDLSDHGNQPMHYQDLVIIYNGEIYNYIEIKEELIEKDHNFVSSCDTEVILAAYKEWGSRCVEKFMGMWSFVIWDKTKKELFCSRDRFGIKPFYYILQGDKFYFASDYKPLKLSPLFTNELNLQQVSRGLQLGWIEYHDESYFETIKCLPPAHNLVFNNGTVSIYPYWDLEMSEVVDCSEEEKTTRFRELFFRSIAQHMRSNVPVASCLSGGLDSSAIVSGVQHLFPGKSYKSFSIYYDGKDDVDEREFIKEVVNKYPAVDPVYYTPSNDEIPEAFEKALYHTDVPATGSSFISQYFLMKLINKNNIKVVLDGQGADEYLAGYMHSFYRLIGEKIKNLNFPYAFKILNELSRQQNYSYKKKKDVFLKSFISAILPEQKLYRLEYERYYPFLVDGLEKKIPFQLRNIAGSKLNNFLYNLIFTTSLPSLLHYEDRNSMAFSIESRVPFLDHRLVEFVFSLPDEDKISSATTKSILRKSLNNILPESITNRKDKKGFVTPGEVKWLRGPLKYLIENNQLPDFINKVKAGKLLRDFNNGDNSKASLVWRLVVLNHWIRNHV